MASIYGFAEKVQGTGSGATAAIRLYDRAVKQATNEAGVVTNPDVYREAREKYLEPLADDVRVSVKMADSVNQENQLRDRKNDVNLVSSVLEEKITGALKDYAKTFYKDPEGMVRATRYVYATAVDELDNEIANRREAGQSIGDLQQMITKYAKKEDELVSLENDYRAFGKPRNPNAYGWFVKTNPNDGSIVDMEIGFANDADKQGAYKRTNKMYGNVPVWTTTYFEDDGKEVARIGLDRFELSDKDDNGQQILEHKAKQWGRYIKSWLPGGEKPSEVKAAERQLNLNNIGFSDILGLPEGSVAKDNRGNYYYYGKDGVYKAPKKEYLEKFLNVTGAPGKDVDKEAFTISRNQVNSFGSFIDDDGKSRIIDDKMLGGFTQPQQPGLPPESRLPAVEQPVSGTFKSAPNALTDMFQSVYNPQTYNSTPAFIVPRKPPAVKTESQVGTKKTSDIIEEQGKKFSRFA